MPLILALIRSTAVCLGLTLCGSLILARSAHADDLDDVLRYLVKERILERQSSDTNPLDPRKQRAHSPDEFFRNVNSYRVDSVTRTEENGAVRLATTYYSAGNGPSFRVKLVHPASTRQAALRSGERSEIETLNRIYQSDINSFSSVVKGYRAAFMDFQKRDKSVSLTTGSILRIGTDMFLVVQTNQPVSLPVMTAFLENLPLDELGESVQAGAQSL